MERGAGGGCVAEGHQGPREDGLRRLHPGGVPQHAGDLRGDPGGLERLFCTPGCETQLRQKGAGIPLDGDWPVAGSEAARLAHVAFRGTEIPPLLLHQGEVVQHHRLAAPVAELAVEREGLLEHPAPLLHLSELDEDRHQV